MKDKILLLLGILTVLIRCWGGVAFRSHLLLGWGILVLGQIFLNNGIIHSSRGLLPLFGFTAAVFGVAGGSIKVLITRALGFDPEPSSILPAALLLFVSLILWEGGAKRFSAFPGKGRHPAIELVTLAGGLFSFFLLVASLYLSPAWSLGDPLMGLTLAVVILYRALPLLVNQTSRFLLGQE